VALMKIVGMKICKNA